MKILIINHYAGSLELGMEYRHFYLAQELKKLGHEVCIIASAYSHLRNKQPDRKDIGPHISSHQGIDYIWLNGCEYSGNGSRRLLNMLGFSCALWRHAKAITTLWKPDIVCASSPHPLQSYGAVKLAKLAKAKFIFEIRDLWPLSLVELAGVSPTHPLIRLFDHAEQYGCKHADTVISLLPAVADYMTSLRDVPLSKLHIIPNGISPDDWLGQAPTITNDLVDHIEAEKGRGHLLVGYTGAHGLPNALDVLLDAAAMLKDQPISFVLVGDGHEKARLLHRVACEGLSNVKMFSPISKGQIPQLLQRFDAAYIGWRRQPLYRFGIAPNKLMDYMMAAIPILHAVEAGNDPVAEAGCGLTVQPENPQAVADGICRLLALSSEERKAMGQRGQAFILENHTYPVLARRFLKACR